MAKENLGTPGFEDSSVPGGGCENPYDPNHNRKYRKYAVDAILSVLKGFYRKNGEPASRELRRKIEEIPDTPDPKTNLKNSI